MVAVVLTAAVRDLVNAAPETRIISVSSSEADDGRGDGDTGGDCATTGPMSLSLRAERAGGGGGREYVVTVESRDRHGNASRQATSVPVPENAH